MLPRGAQEDSPGQARLEFARDRSWEATRSVRKIKDPAQAGDDHIRFDLIGNEERTRRALRGIEEMLPKGVVSA